MLGDLCIAWIKSVATLRRWPLPEGESLTSAVGFHFQKVTRISWIAVILSTDFYFYQIEPKKFDFVFDQTTPRLLIYIRDLRCGPSKCLTTNNASICKKHCPSTRFPCNHDDHPVPVISTICSAIHCILSATEFSRCCSSSPVAIERFVPYILDQCSAYAALLDLYQ